MATLLNTDKLSFMVKAKRGERGLRAVAQEIGGLSASTLSRIEQGNVPDVDTFFKICKWLKVSTDEFTDEKTKKSVEPGTQEIILAHLRADRTLSKKTVQALSEMINLAYQNH
jgi:transcriptional regulator with XRE-family HTH domain